jgi:TatD DNase family protein
VTYLDAHNHLHDARLASHRESIIPELARLPVGRAVVNGTREDDWADVESLGTAHPWIVPSYGLHPWYAPDRSNAWLERLRKQLTKQPSAAVGEIGLDRWVKGHDLEVQRPVFLDQVRLAVELDRPATIHCVRAWGAMLDALRDEKLPSRGFLLHAYGGPAEMIDEFVQRGAYFSFSPYFLHDRKAAQRDAFSAIPADRILVETDAPDLRPPDGANPRPIIGSDGNPANHPANIDVAYRGLAMVRGMQIDELASVVSQNFARLFGLGGSN